MLALARLLDRHEQQQARQQVGQVTFQAPAALGHGLQGGPAAQQHPVTAPARSSPLEASECDRVRHAARGAGLCAPSPLQHLLGSAPCDQCAALRLLLGRGADSQTALVMAAEAGNAAAIPVIVAAGADVRSEHGHRAMAAAVSWCNVAAVAALLAAGADVDAFVRTVWKVQYQTRAITWVEVNAVMLVAAGADVQSNLGLSNLVARAALGMAWNWKLSALESCTSSYAGTPAHAEAVAQAAAAQARITALLQRKEEEEEEAAQQRALIDAPPTAHDSAARSGLGSLCCVGVQALWLMLLLAWTERQA